jgi:hypothetical protein
MVRRMGQISAENDPFMAVFRDRSVESFLSAAIFRVMSEESCLVYN